MADEITQPTSTDVLVEGPDWLTQEKLDGLLKGDIDRDSLEPEQGRQFHEFMEKQLTGKATSAKPAAAAAAPEVSAGEKPAGGVTSPEDVPAKRPQDKTKFFEDHKRLQVETNRQKQLLANAGKERITLLAKIDELKKKPVTAAGSDTMEPDTIRNLQERLLKTEDLVTALAGHVQNTAGLLEEEYTTRASTLEADTILLGLEKFQLETTDPDFLPEDFSLKTTVPISDLKNEIEQFATALGGLQNVNKYLQDEAYRAQVEARGHKLSEGFLANLDKYNLIWSLNKDVVEGKFPDHKVAYISHIIQEGKLKTWQRSAKLDGANAVANEISRKTTQTPLLKPGEGPKPSAAGWTLASARQWYFDHPDVKPGSSEAATKSELSELIRTGQLK